MAFSISSITNLLKRNKKAQDPFGGDDEDFYDEDVFDDESDGGTLGRKIAMGVSGLLGVLIVGFIATAIMTADDSAGPVTGAIPTEIAQVVSEDGEVLETFDMPGATPTEGSAAPAATGPIALPPLTSTEPTAGAAMPMPSTAIVDDSTAETDRSSTRRPWLATGAGTPPGTRLTREQPAPQATPGRAASMADLLERSRESNPASRPAAPLPTADTASMPAATTDMAAMPTVAEDAGLPEAMPQETAAIAPTVATPLALPDPGLVPGAPRRFAQGENVDAGPATAGGAPRLTEPVLPPTDSRAVSAAPPRFTTLPDAEQLVQDPNAKARVAIIVEGLGLNRSATEAAISSLPPAVTLAFSPYARNLADWLAKAIEAGHEVLVEVPMESKRFPADDPGPLGLLTSLDQIENVERLTAILAESNGSAGVLDVSGSRFRESTEHINLVMNNLDARGLFYVQGRPGLRLGNDRVPTATADIVIDERAFRAAIDARLDYIERLAKYQGSSVAVASAKPVTFERIALWLDEVGHRGVAVAPVSQVLIQ